MEEENKLPTSNDGIRAHQKEQTNNGLSHNDAKKDMTKKKKKKKEVKYIQTRLMVDDDLEECLHQSRGRIPDDCNEGEKRKRRVIDDTIPPSLQQRSTNHSARLPLQASRERNDSVITSSVRSLGSKEESLGRKEDGSVNRDDSSSLQSLIAAISAKAQGELKEDATTSTKSLSYKEEDDLQCHDSAKSNTLDDSASRLSNVGAIHISGPRGMHASGSDDIISECAIEDDGLSRVEAHLVSDEPDVEAILSRRLNDEVELRLREERASAVFAEVIGSRRQRTFGFSRRKLVCYVSIAVLLAIAVAISVGVLVSKSSSKNGPTPSPAEWSRASYVESVLVTKWNGTRTWTKIATPQFNAFLWLTSEDTFDIRTLTPNQIVERFIAAIIYFSAKQSHAGSSPLSYFLQPVSVCKWNTGIDNSSNLEGLTCSNGFSIDSVELGKHSYRSPRIICHLLIICVASLCRNW